jgi:hypothetical protein
VLEFKRPYRLGSSNVTGTQHSITLHGQLLMTFSGTDSSARQFINALNGAHVTGQADGYQQAEAQR